MGSMTKSKEDYVFTDNEYEDSVMESITKADANCESKDEGSDSDSEAKKNLCNAIKVTN